MQNHSPPHIFPYRCASPDLSPHEAPLGILQSFWVFIRRLMDSRRIVAHPKPPCAKWNSSTNRLTGIRRLGCTCETLGIRCPWKNSFFLHFLRANAPLYLAARAECTFSQIQQGVCSGIYLQRSPQPGHIIRDSVIQRAWSPVQTQSLSCHIHCYNYLVTWDVTKTWDHCGGSLPMLSWDCLDWLGMPLINGILRW